LVGLQPDIILTCGAAAIAAVQRETRTIPIVFATADDPIAGNLGNIGSKMTEDCPMFSRLGAMYLEQN
jgi:ABC-type uncharacterized transport system substrate-binding protein